MLILFVSRLWWLRLFVRAPNGGSSSLRAAIKSSTFVGYAGAGLALAHARDVTLSALLFDSDSPAAAGCVSVPFLASSLEASASTFSRCVSGRFRGPSTAAFGVTAAAPPAAPLLSFDLLRFVDAGGPLAVTGPARVALARSSFDSSSPNVASAGGCLAIRDVAAPAGTVAVSDTDFARCVHPGAAGSSSSVASVLVEGRAPGAASVAFERVRVEEPGGPLEVALAESITLSAVSVASAGTNASAAGGLLLRPIARRLALRDVNCTRCLARDRAAPYGYPLAAPGALFAAGPEDVNDPAMAALEVDIEGLRLESCAGGAASLHAIGSATVRAIVVENDAGDVQATGGLAVSNLAGPFTARDVVLVGASSKAAAASSSTGALAVQGVPSGRAGRVSLENVRVEDNEVAAMAALFFLGSPNGAGVTVANAESLSIRASRFAGNRVASPGVPGGSLQASDVREVRLEGCSFEGDEAAGDGGSVSVSLVGSVSLRGVSVRGSRAIKGNGGCLAVRDLAGAFTAHSLDLSACNATGIDSSATFNGARFSACSAAASAEVLGHAGGGAAYVANLAAASFEDSEFEGNADRGQAFKEVAAPRAEGGGALLAVGIQNFTVWRARFVSNAALVKGGAIAAVQVPNAAMHFCTFERNVVDNAGAVFPSFGGGGAVSFEGKDGLAASLLVQNSTFSKNVETQFGGGQMRGGGAIWAETASLVSVQGSTFTGNVAQRGGALSVWAQTLFVEESEFASNGWPADVDAGRVTDGGAIDAHLSGPAASVIARTSFAKNSGAKGGAVRLATDGTAATPARMEGVSFLDNAASASGGALVVSQLDLAATGVTFRGNSAGLAGGALLVDADKRCTVRFASSSFIRNDAQEGGAVALLTSTATVRLEFWATPFTLNEAKNNGGAVSKENGELLVSDSSFESNHALAAGGAVYMSDNVGWARFTDTSMTANTAAENGGALAAVLRSTPTLIRCALRRNVAKANGGAAWCMKSSVCTLAASSVESGAADRGGAVYVDQDASLVLDGVSLSRNAAEMAGGAILAGTRARITIRGGSISANQAPRGGGILCDDDSSTLINGTAITVNLAASQGKEARPDGTGGGICVASNSSCTLLGGTLVTANRADAGAGVAVLNTARLTAGVEDIDIGSNRRALLQAGNATAVPVTVVLIGANVATGNGAGLLQSGGVVRLLRGVQLAENTAGGRGGGLFYESGTIDLKGALISKNHATDGGGAYIRPTNCSSISIKGVSVQDNYATGGGGAFFVDAKDPTACAPFASLASGTSEFFTRLDGNTGRFGGGVAAVPATIVLFGPRNVTPPHNETTPASRMPLYYKVEVRDSFNQIVKTATGAVVVVTALGDASVAGTPQMVMFEGAAEFKDLQVVAQPGATVTIVFTATFPDGAVLTATSALVLRQCMRGEVLEENRAYCPTCSYCKLCPPGTYSLEDSTFRGKECRACPTGASCVFGGSDVRPLKGFWQSPYDPHHFLQCVNQACLTDYANGVLNKTGAADLVSANLTNAQFFGLAEPCTEGYNGNLCTVCDDGWGRRSDFECQQCLAPVYSRLLAAAVITFLIVIAAFLIRKHIKSFGKQVKDERGGILLKIFFDYLQLISMAKAFQIRWPAVFTDLLYLQTSIANPLDALMSIDCMFDLNVSSRVIRPFYARVIGWISIPLLCVLIPCVILVAQPAWHRFRSWRRRVTPSDSDSARTRSHARDNYYVSVVVSLYLVHPQITQKMFKLFSCRDLGGGRSYLQQDMKVDCNTLEFRLWQWGLGAPAIVVYGFGIPVAAFLVLYRNRHRLEETAFKRKFSFLYRGYKQRCWYWECVVIVRKLFVAVVVSVLDGRPQVQGLVGLGILLATLVVKLKLKPWDSALLELVDFCGLLVATVTIYAGLFFYTPDSLNQIDESVITYSLVVVNMLFIAFFIVVYFREWAVKILARLADRHPAVARWRDRLTVRYDALRRRYGLVERLDELLSGKNDGQNMSMKIRRLFRNGTADLHRLAADDRGAAVELYRKAEARLQEDRANKKGRLPALVVNLNAAPSPEGEAEPDSPRTFASPEIRSGFFDSVNARSAQDGDSGGGLGEGSSSGANGGEGEEERPGARRPNPASSDFSPPGTAQSLRPPEGVEVAYDFAPIAPLWAMGESLVFPPPPPSPSGVDGGVDGGGRGSVSVKVAPFTWEGREGEFQDSIRARRTHRLEPLAHTPRAAPAPAPAPAAVRSRTELLQVRSRSQSPDGDEGDRDATAAIAQSVTGRFLLNAGPWTAPVVPVQEALSPRPVSALPDIDPDARSPLPGTIDGDREGSANEPDRERESAST
eukprot:tig00020592_g11693.t1